MRRFSHLVVMVVLAAACGGNETASELDAAEERWAASGVSDYNLEVGYGCFCVPERIGPFEIKVRGAEVVEIRFEGALIQPEPGVTPVEAFTVEGLFEEIRSSLDADEITVSYGELGNPTLIDIDRMSDAEDDELSITAILTTP